MVTGPDATGDWINAPLLPGTSDARALKNFTPAAPPAVFTFQFIHYYQPTTGDQRTTVELATTDEDAAVLGVVLHYTGTAAGSVTTLQMYDNADDDTTNPITLPPGANNAIKITYDGTTALAYVNDVVVATWLRTLDQSPANIGCAWLRMFWATGFGSDIFLKQLIFSATI